MDHTTQSDRALLQEKGFNLEKVVGDGSFSKVFKAIKLSPDNKHRTVLACKVIDTSLAPRDYLTNFLPRELDVLIRVNHPHIIHVSDIFLRRSRYFIFMRLGENGDLFEFVCNNGRIPEKQSRLWMRQLISGLNYMHTLNIAHRDLKCENVVITANYNVKLTDFGFARYVRRMGADILSETYCGTLSYAAPEVLKGVPYLPKLADIWSMGIILYTMLNQSLPFRDNTVKELYEKQQIKRKWKFRTMVVNELSSECKQQVTQMMEPNAAARPSAESVLHGQWISMDQRIAKLSFLEESLLKKAAAAEKRPKYNNEEAIQEVEFHGPTEHPAGFKILKNTENGPQSHHISEVYLKI